MDALPLLAPLCVLVGLAASMLGAVSRIAVSLHRIADSLEKERKP